MEGDHLMASDITLAVRDGTRRTTYAELADTTRRPTLRVIESGHTQLIADIESVVEDLSGLEARLVKGREELRRLLALLGPISMTMSWRR